MDRPIRKPMRLREYDYSSPGAYFITICTREKECLLSRILVGAGVLDGPKVELSSCGMAVEETLRDMDRHYPRVSIDRFVIMPNHIHLLLCISAGGPSGTPAPTNAVLPSLISYLKRTTNRNAASPSGSGPITTM
ncbi:MAG: hypothetical protein IJH38_04735 [Clostridia bacterium]|nr:hypothetical protein [Clostridia bacterium]